MNDCVETLSADASREENTNNVFQEVFAKMDLRQLEKNWIEFIWKMQPAQGHGHFEKGQVLLEEREYQQALSEFNNAIEADGTYFRYYYFRARTYYSLKRYDQAIKDLKKALDISPEYNAALFLLVRAYYRKKDYVRAKESILELVEYESIYKEKAEELLDEINQRLRQKD